MIKSIIRIGLAASVLAASAHADLVSGFDQRYESSGYNSSTGLWDDSAGSADATANNLAAFTATTTPNGTDAVANSTAQAFMDFTRASSLGGATGMLTVQAVIRIDGTVDDRSGPFALAQTSGWGGLYMGAQTDGVNDLRAGNVGNSGTNNTVLRVDNGGSSVTAGTWGIYTLVVDATQNTSPQMTASFVLLSDLSNVFTVTASASNLATATNLGLGTGGVLFGGERGNTATNNATGGWNGAIADVVVYNSALSAAQINSNLIEFQNLYQSAPTVAEGLKSGLLSYWAFEGGLTDSAHGVTGTNSVADDLGSWDGTAAFGTGRFGQGVVLTGSQNVSIPDSVDLDRTNSDLSVSAWFRVDGWSVAWQALLAKGESNTYRIARQSSNANKIAYAGGTGDISGGAVNDGQWHHVVGTTLHGGHTKLWIDGVMVAESTTNAALTNFGNGTVQPFLIGSNPQETGRRWVGAIDEVAIWNRVLDTDEIELLAGGVPLFADPFLVVDSEERLSGTAFNGGAVQRTIPISNSGISQTLNISGVVLGGADAASFSVDSFPATLAPGGNGEIVLTFTPLAQGIYSSTLTIASNSEGSPSTQVAVEIEALPDLVDGVTFRVYQANRALTQMPILGSDQTPNVDELRTTVNYKDSDKDGIADVGSDGNFGAVPPLDQLDNLYCEAIGYLQITNPGNYQFRLTADDGAQMNLDGSLLINNSGFERASAVTVTSSLTNLDAGLFPFDIQFWSGTGEPSLKLEWLRPGSAIWEVVPTYVGGSVDDGMVTENATRVVSTGDKLVYYAGEATGELDQVHPGYDLFTIAGDYDKAYPGEGRPNPANLTIDGTATTFRPQVGAMAFLPDGRLLLANFQPPAHGSAVAADNTLDHKIYALTGVTGNDLNAITVKEVASGLSRPSGICVVGSDVYVCELHKIIRLRDNNSDGDFLDAGEETEIIGAGTGWTTNNYHQFTFGMLHQDGYLYGTLSTSIVFGSGGLGLNGYNTENRGTWFRVDTQTGQIEFLAGGLRTPNGIGFGPEGKMFGTDNQGSWNPSNSLYEFTENHFYGHYNQWFQDSATDPVRNPNGVAATGYANPDRQPSAFWDSSVYWEAAETPVYASPHEGGTRRFTHPAVYLPQGDISRSPTEPVLIGNQHPAFKGQMFVGELTMGGIRRVFLEKVNGRFQGAVFRFTQGMVAGNNRLVWGPDGALYAGGMGPGDNSNWSWRGTWFGLQRIKPNASNAFEIQTMRAVEDGFLVTFTKPVNSSLLSNIANYEAVENWTYDGQTYDYGAGRTELADLTVTLAEPLADGRSVRLTIPGLVAESVVHLQVKGTMQTVSGEPLWSGEAFYTLNAIPDEFESAWAEWVTLHFPGVADLDVIGLDANPDGDDDDNYSEFVRGGDPAEADRMKEVQIASDGTSFELTVRERDPLPLPATAWWEASPDLDSWQDITEDMERVGSTSVGNGISDVHYDYTPPANTPKLFIRRASAIPK